MFDFDAGKLLVIGVVALIVIGPKELPRVLRQVGQAIGKLRRLAGEFQTQFMDAMKEAELDDLRKEADKLASATKVDLSFDEVKNVESDIKNALEDRKPVDPAIEASLRDDPDGVFLHDRNSNAATLPIIEPAAPVVLPEPVAVAAATPADSIILPEPADPAPRPAAKSGEA